MLNCQFYFVQRVKHKIRIKDTCLFQYRELKNAGRHLVFGNIKRVPAHSENDSQSVLNTIFC